MYACWQCGKGIKRGRVIHHIPSRLMVEIGADFPKAFHPKCYGAFGAAEAPQGAPERSEDDTTGGVR